MVEYFIHIVDVKNPKDMMHNDVEYRIKLYIHLIYSPCINSALSIKLLSARIYERLFMLDRNMSGITLWISLII